MGIYGNKYDKNEVLNEGVITGILASILLILFGPYLLALAVMIIASPIIKIKEKSNKNWKEDILRDNPNITDSLLKLVEALKKYIIKAMGEDSKYVEFYNISEKDFDFRGPNKLDKNNNKIFIYFCKIDCMKLLKDKTGYNNSQEYFKSINWDDSDYLPPIPVECRKVITKFNNIIDQANKYFKLIGNTSMIKIERTIGKNEDELTKLDAFYFHNEENDARLRYERIGSHLEVTFGDYSNIDLPEKTQKEVDKIINNKK